MTKKTNLVQVSPQEWIRRNPGESDAAVKQRWLRQEAAYAEQRQQRTRNLQRAENLDRMVMSSAAANKKWGNKVISASGTGYGSTRNR